ncbi:hypothetical protein MHU86_6702 [Fragilaria crotonensis]|nr:hypothetical protein MHU86_6702 [Fragilaria crotonensis]
MNRQDNTGNRAGLSDLPPELFSNILASFCDGKSISTFLLASQVSHNFDAFDTVQNCLVVRYEDLSEKIKDPDITETLQILIQKIRACERSFLLHTVKLFSEACAMLDYFETHLLFGRHWLIWCGDVECFYGKIQAFITSPYWSISAIASWYRDLELTQFSLVRPRVPIHRPAGFPFGSIVGRGLHDSHLIDRLRVKLDPNIESPEYWKGMMTAIQFAYDLDPSLVITTHSYPTLEGEGKVHVPKWLPIEKSLCCYWDDFEAYDDDDLLNLGEHIIRLMQRFSAMNSPPFASRTGQTSTPSFRESWIMTVKEHQGTADGEVDDDDESDDASEDESGP